jgi:hypothetical protein
MGVPPWVVIGLLGIKPGAGSFASLVPGKSITDIGVEKCSKKTPRKRRPKTP